jgi:DNA-binding response OmpR family regulator
MEDFLDIRANKSASNANKPLLGLNILLLEDSRYFAESIRLMSVHSGARLRRAVSLETAERHLKGYYPDVILVDLGLPDGSGIDFIKDLAQRPSGPIATIAISGNDDGATRHAALEAGAKCFLSKPMQDLASFQQVILSVVPQDEDTPRFKPRLVGEEIEPNLNLLMDDLTQIDTLLEEAVTEGDESTLTYCSQFLRSIARAAQDHELQDAAINLSARCAGGPQWQHACKHAQNLIRKRTADTHIH